MASPPETLGEVNEYQKYRKPIQEIIDFTSSIDERYREKCFEILLNHYLCANQEIKVPQQSFSVTESKISTSEVKDSRKYPFDLQTFLTQYNITDEIIDKLFSRANGEIKPIYKITETQRAIAQIQVTLLTAFENALLTPNGVFEFSMKAARQRCIDYKVYSGIDFFFYYRNRAGLFTNLNYEVVRLSPVGKEELAKLMIALSKQ
jgi:hypothetical protein